MAAIPRETATKAIETGMADAIAFGSPLIANPDFVRRLEHGYPLAAPNADLFYTNDQEGYTDYPTLSAEPQESAVANVA